MILEILQSGIISYLAKMFQRYQLNGMSSKILTWMRIKNEIQAKKISGTIKATASNIKVENLEKLTKSMNEKIMKFIGRQGSYINI